MKRPDLHVSMSPFMHSGDSVRRIMLDYLLALVPVLLAGIFYYGWPALKIVALCTLTAVLTELLWQKVMGQAIRISDGSALVTGILLGLVLSSLVPWWLAVAGAFTAVVVGKHLLGGLGNHPFSPVVVGWTFVQVSYNAYMSDYPIPEPLFGMETGAYLADPYLVSLPEDMEMASRVPGTDLFVGNVPGEIGTGCVLAVLLGGVYLLARGRITWHIPVGFIASA
ncbi:MAG: RnfABCDGE type electron transport complex subunit D, partial [Deltaproteobacteria bacterium]|nr:RnfABCDGE type electron transport complex subunit D [Deltaproteobacteria bacterium]